ncbi:MAG: EFR1 family ferrodoxin [Bacilli bacterium]
MKINIIYFSGTGNSKYVANYLSEKLINSSNEVNIYSIEENYEINEEVDLLIIGGPIYAGNVPEKLIKSVLRNIPDRKIDCIVYTTSAGLLNANGVDSLAKKLDKKGYNIIAKETYEMPRNFYFGKYKKNTKEEINKIINNTNKQLDILVNNINMKNLYMENMENKGVLTKDLLAETFSIMAKFMGKNFSVDENCTKCGMCVKKCPEKNIIFDSSNNIKFLNKCMMCTRCIHSCPKNAINYKKKKYDQYSIKM